MTISNMVFKLDLGKHTAPRTEHLPNEDNIGYYFPQQPEVLLLRGQMFIIADGSGEEGLGEFASKMAIQTVIQEYYEEPWVGTVEEMLSKAVLRTNQVIYDANVENKSTSYFSTSLTCTVIHQERLYLAHVGNCCAFLISDNHFEVLTQSHTFDIQQGIRAVDIQGAEGGKILIRSLGTAQEVNIDLTQRQLQMNDIIFLCTDGVHNAVPEQEIQRMIASASPQQACESIVNQAIKNQTDDDATALIIKVKSIKRIEADEKPTVIVAEPSQPAERQIVIKGIRYRTTKAEELPPEEEEIVAEFSQHRDIRRPIFRRQAHSNRKGPLPIRPLLNKVTWVIFFVFMVFLLAKYIPQLWHSLLKSPEVKAPADQSTQMIKQEPEPEQPKEEVEKTPVVYPEIDQIEDTSEFISDEAHQFSGTIAFNVVIVDGSSRQNLTWTEFIKEMKMFSAADRITQVKSSLKLKNSKVIWLQSANISKQNLIKERADHYQQLLSRYFHVTAQVLPFDLTLVIGADFKLPQFQTSYRETQANSSEPYYLEILNGYTVPGLARRLSEQLDNRKINNHRTAVIDFRNADTKNYRISFIKCDASRNHFAEELKRCLKLNGPIENSRLYDIKVIVGTDIVM